MHPGDDEDDGLEPKKPDARVGQVLLGRYRVVRRIAEGGMGAVYEGEQLALKRRVALKFLHAHLAQHDDIVTRFRREALATTHIGHPHIVEVLDLAELPDGTVFMALELLAGRDLARALKDDGPMRISRAVHVLDQIADGVGAAHDKGIVHRDLKPENVFLVEREGDRDFVKIVDFGISKIRDATLGVESNTRTGTAMGTPYYMAPEQAQGKRDVDHRADVYALGVILFRLLTGHHPFDDTSYPVLVVKICTEPPPSIQAFRPDVPDELARAVEQMLAKDPKERPESCRAVRAKLAPFRALDAAPRIVDAPSPASLGASALERSSPRTTERDHSPAAMARTAHVGRTRSAREEEEDEAMKSTVAPQRSNGPMLAGIGVLAIATLGIVGYAVMGGGDAPVEREPEAIALPTPTEPVVHALTPRGDGVGWTWVNPRPRAMPTWLAIAVGGPGLVAFVGQDGAAGRFLSNGLMVTWRSGVTSTLRGVAWTGTDSAIAVGDAGTAVRLTERGPERIDTGVEVTLRGAVSVSGTEAIVVGDGGTVLRIVGDRVTRVDVGTQAALLAVHQREGASWIVGESGTIIRLEAGRFGTEQAPARQTLRAIGGCDAGHLYAAGDDGTVLIRRPDGWHTLRLDHPTQEAFMSITCDRGHAAIVGAAGNVVLASATTNVRMPSGFEGTWHSVSGARDETTWMVGSGGRLASIESDHVQTRTDGPTVPLRDVGSIGGAIVAVGEWGRIVREGERGYAEAESPTDAALAALAVIDEGHLLAVGDNGAIVEIGPTDARLMSSPTQANLRDVVIEGGQVLAVGTEGTLLRGPPDGLTSSRIPDVGHLWALAGTPTDALAVGDAGAVVHVSGSGATRWPCDTTASLHGVVRRGTEAWAVGERGTIVRLGEGGCTREHDGGPTLEAVGLGPDGRPLAVGEEGTALVRGDDGTWAAAELDIGRTSLRAIERIERHVWLVGSGGVLVRHVLVDGT